MRDTMTQETIYTMPYETEKDIRAANDLRNELYDKYNSVNVYPNGLSEVRIVATDEVFTGCEQCGDEKDFMVRYTTTKVCGKCTRKNQRKLTQ